MVHLIGLFSLFFLFHSNGVNATIEYILEVYSISPLFGSLLGGTSLTISGSGFSNNASDNKVSVGKQHEVQQAQARQLTSDEKRGTRWTGLQVITGLVYRGKNHTFTPIRVAN